MHGASSFFLLLVSSLVHYLHVRLALKSSPAPPVLQQRVAVVADDGDGAVPVAPTTTLGWGWEDAREWWARKVFGKTFVERRSWLTMGRAFFRVWLFLILEFQVMCIFLWGWDTRYRYYWLTTVPATHAFASLCYEIAGAWTQRSTMRGVRVLGNPFWRHHARGILDWIIINAVLALSFVVQWLNFLNGVTLWWYVAGGYSGLVVLQAVLTQRDGYCVSLTHTVGGWFRACGLVPFAWLFEWIGASSARYPAEQYLMPYHLKVPCCFVKWCISCFLKRCAYSTINDLILSFAHALCRLGGLPTSATCSSGCWSSVPSAPSTGSPSCRR